MQYLGSKNKIAKHILPIMLEARGDRTWVEPFVGGANMIDKVDGRRIGNDIHKCLIALLNALQNGWVPPTEITREDYYEIKDDQKGQEPELVGFVGFLCSFGGKWWGGYAHNAKGANYAARGSRCLLKQAKSLSGIDFRCGNYLEMETPPHSLIYCDPPYAGATGYKDSFNHVQFWQWCRAKGEEGHRVYVSEYNAPKDFVCLKTIEHKTVLNKNKPVLRIEKLFEYRRP